MEINTFGTQQSHIVNELNASVLDKNLNETNEHSVTIGNHDQKGDIGSSDPNLGQNINLFA